MLFRYPVKACVFLFVVLLAGLNASHTVAQSQELADKFERRSHTGTEITLPYRLFVPEDYDPSVEYPMVVVLHGLGSAFNGTDNEKHIMNLPVAISWADSTVQSRWPAFVMAPQAPDGDGWASPNYGDTLRAITRSSQTVVEILDSLQTEFSIDSGRVSLIGFSMGGWGSFDFAVRYPGRFAAIVPISGGSNPNFIDSLAQQSMWIVHGESDNQSPAIDSRSIVDALVDLGRQAVFTHCASIPFNCAPIRSEKFEAAIDAHANLIYTGYPGLGHVPEVVENTIEDPRLAPWVFAQHRAARDGIRINEPAGTSIWSGSETIRWDVTEPAESGELWFSSNNGRSWVRLDSTLGNTGEFIFDTESVDDTPFAKLRLVFFESGGLVHRREDSKAFVIDNPDNGTPIVFVDDEGLLSRPVIRDESLTLMVVAADVDNEALEATISFSTDAGLTFGESNVLTLESSTVAQPVNIDLAGFPNTSQGVIRIEVSDGQMVAEYQTRAFRKVTPRASATAVTRVSGEGGADIRVNWVDPSVLTGHRYRVNFNDARPAATAFSVTDLETDQIVLENIPVSDGTVESPPFDGIRLIVRAFDRGTVNPDSTGWRAGDADSEVTITAPLETLDGEVLEFLATPDDYRITITEGVVDTSLAMFGFGSTPVRFVVENTTAGERRSVLFEDFDSDGLPTGGRSVQDRVIILEDDGTGILMPTWSLAFRSRANPPEDGDQFVLRTFKKTSEADVFEFEAVVGVAIDEDAIPGEIELLRGFPNPFTDAATIQYRLADPSEVTLDVFNVVGQRVGRIDRGFRSGGLHSVRWQPDSDDGRHLAPGIYFARLTAEGSLGSRSIKVLRLVHLR
jgi:pimeloyl-ACP methyl ester carboxylesterase